MTTSTAEKVEATQATMMIALDEETIYALLSILSDAADHRADQAEYARKYGEEYTDEDRAKMRKRHERDEKVTLEFSRALVAAQTALAGGIAITGEEG